MPQLASLIDLIPGIILLVFFVYGLRNKARKDGAFIALGLTSLLIIIFETLNVFFCNMGAGYHELSIIFFTLFFALCFLQIGILTIYKVYVFRNDTKYSATVYILISIVTLTLVFLILYNLKEQTFFIYNPKKMMIDRRSYEGVIMNFFIARKEFSLLIFLLSILMLTYEFLNITRIFTRTIVNSTKEILVASVSLFHYFSILSNTSNSLFMVRELYYFSISIPFVYYIITYYHKPLLVRMSFRSSFFDNTKSLCVIFNADSYLVDFNSAAQDFFGFDRKDILTMTMDDFLLKRVPIGFTPVNNFYIEQFELTGVDQNNALFEVEFHRKKYLNKMTVCSYFLFRDITKIVKRFDDLQLASNTDDMTGLLEHHVLSKKVKEINLYRKFPYTAVTCTPVIKHQFNDSSLNNKNLTLVHISDIVKKTIRNSDFAAYDNGMIIILFPTNLETTEEAMVRISQKVKKESKLDFDFDFIYGMETRSDPDTDMQKAINQAQIRMELKASLN